jgi:large subunit ribosomal protein L22
MARLRFARITPRKLRYVVDLIRGKDYNTAVAILRTVPNRGAYFTLKLLQSAMANAIYVSGEKRFDINVDKLHIVDVRVDPGPMFKRWRPMSMARAGLIKKRTSHLTIVLEEREPKETKKERAKRRKEGRKEMVSEGSKEG